jgi:hypothetical protein
MGHGTADKSIFLNRFTPSAEDYPFQLRTIAVIRGSN